MPSRQPLLLWILVALSGIVWAAGLIHALLNADPLPIALWLSVPPLGVLLLGWLATRAGLASAHHRLRRRLGDPIPPLRADAAARLARGLGLGALACCVFEGIAAYAADAMEVLLAAGIGGVIALAAALFGHLHLARQRRLQVRPWRALMRLRGLASFADPAPVDECFQVLLRATSDWLTPAQGRALQDRARPILLGLRDHALTELTELAGQGRGGEALTRLETWRSRATEFAALFAFLQITPERLAQLQREVESASAHHWAERRATLEPLLAEAALLLEEGQPALALSKIDETAMQITGEGAVAMADLRERALLLQSRAREKIAEVHRAAVVVKRAESSIQEGVEKAREAILYARQHLGRGDRESAAGWLVEADRLVDTVPDPEGTSLRAEIASLRPQCQERPMHCPACQADLPDGARFCPRCGKAVPMLSQATPPPGVSPIRYPPRPALGPLPELTTPTERPRSRLWQDQALVITGFLILIGFFLPWQRALAEPFGLGANPFGGVTGARLFAVFGAATRQTATGAFDMALLAQMEVFALFLLLATGGMAVLLGLLVLGSPSLPRRGVYLILRVAVAVSWVGVLFLGLRLLLGDSAVGAAMISGAEASGGMLGTALRNSSVGVWVLLIAFPVMTVAAFTRKT
jgi:hypothetical protein